MKQFKHEEGFFSTLLHEMTHSTGHHSRLNRNFGKEGYAQEELTAEMGATMAAMRLGVQADIDKQNAIYIKGWLSACKQDDTFIYRCVKDAVKASNYICDKLGVKTELEIIKESSPKESPVSKQRQDTRKQYTSALKRPIPRSRKGMRC